MRAQRKQETFVNVQRLRDQLEWLRARYDGGATSAAVYSMIRRIESDLAWAEHNDNWQQIGEPAMRVVNKLRVS
jgi:hypothetical protein